jgi:hypothetical protein
MPHSDSDSDSDAPSRNLIPGDAHYHEGKKSGTCGGAGRGLLLVSAVPMVEW